MGDQLCKAHILNFSNLREDESTLRIEVRVLEASHTIVIPPISQIIPTILELMFNLFKDNKPSTDSGKR